MDCGRGPAPESGWVWGSRCGEVSLWECNGACLLSRDLTVQCRGGRERLEKERSP